MKEILILSDTHSYIDDRILHYAENSDEIWHAGDIGDKQVLNKLEKVAPVRAVYGNIDDTNIQLRVPLDQLFRIEGITVFMTHIIGRPGKYPARVRRILRQKKPSLVICGHSHMLLIRRHLNHLHLNPGACGIQGFHRVRTMIKLKINAGKISDVEVIELARRGGLS